MFSGRLARIAQPVILAILSGFLGTLSGPRALAQPPETGPSKARKGQQKDALTADDLEDFDRKFRVDLDFAQAESGREKFREAEAKFDIVIQETESFIQRLANATLPKNGFIVMNGLKTPMTVDTETALFQRTLTKAQNGKLQAEALRNVVDIETQAADLLNAGKYLDARDSYQKAKDALALNRAKIDDSTFQVYQERAEIGQRESITTLWGNEYGRLRDKYNRTTEDGKMSPEEIRRTIESVAEEISTKGYTDPSKHPDMPSDARDLFRHLLDVANQFLKSQ
jgi:hypothetical protein